MRRSQAPSVRLLSHSTSGVVAPSPAVLQSGSQPSLKRKGAFITPRRQPAEKDEKKLEEDRHYAVVW